MSHRRLSAYTLLLLLWSFASLFAVGCGGPRDAGSSTSASSEANQSQTDPEIPTVTLPDEDAGASGSSANPDGTAE
jgi:hypothetical protein